MAKVEISPWIAIALYVGIALVWLVPDRRIETVITSRGHEGPE
jgi:hypothetical protein